MNAHQQQKQQREMPFLAPIAKPRFADESIVKSFVTYRDAVVWTWENRINTGCGERADQALCANRMGLPTPHMNRCVKRESSAPMNLCPDYLPEFEAFCGWRAVSQLMARQAQLTFMEQVLEERERKCA